ncbi:MAG TPA: hypothetical protein VG102_02950, partial [Candidatus Paceibacterota bacterium]|jgi:ribulose-phosphate 3-epimerase|nr:hypothetical protein [Candidatus Paceibacterota bacterium]
MSEIEIIPTIVPSSFADVEAFIALDRSFATMFHIDAADGVFAPNKTCVPGANEKLPESDKLFFEAHLMMAQPEVAGLAFVAAGARRIIAHVEAFGSENDPKRIFDVWKAAGVKEIGIAFLIGTPLEALEPYLYQCDSVTLMSIASIGKQGIPFDDRAFGRVTDLHARYPDLLIEIDGGVGEIQIGALARAGARRFSVGSAIAKAPDPAAMYQKLKSLAEFAIQ